MEDEWSRRQTIFEYSLVILLLDLDDDVCQLDGFGRKIRRKGDLVGDIKVCADDDELAKNITDSNIV